jgi:hypothetical protein
MRSPTSFGIVMGRIDAALQNRSVFLNGNELDIRRAEIYANRKVRDRKFSRLLIR